MSKRLKKLKEYKVSFRTRNGSGDIRVLVVVARSKSAAVIEIVRVYNVDEILGVRKIRNE